MAERLLASLLTPDEAERLAATLSYERGVGYREDGRVEVASVSDRRAEAVVRGTMPYRGRGCGRDLLAGSG